MLDDCVDLAATVHELPSVDAIQMNKLDGTERHRLLGKRPDFG